MESSYSEKYFLDVIVIGVCGDYTVYEHFSSDVNLSTPSYI
jgi:hypothetical protein